MLCRGEQVCHVELFEPEDLDTALAHCEERCAPRRGSAEDPV